MPLQVGVRQPLPASLQRGPACRRQSQLSGKKHTPEAPAPRLPPLPPLRVMQITEALRLRGRNVTMVIVDECPTYQFLRRLVENGVEVECLAEVEDKSIAYILKRRTFAVVMMMLWFFNERNLPERRAPADFVSAFAITHRQHRY